MVSVPRASPFLNFGPRRRLFRARHVGFGFNQPVAFAEPALRILGDDEPQGIAAIQLLGYVPVDTDIIRT